MNNQKFSIKKATLKKSSVDILWNDGKISYFHFLWLRDNCPSSFHNDTRMRKFNIFDVTENIHPIHCLLNNNGDLLINWSEESHQSIFSSQWLRSNCYTTNNIEGYGLSYSFWNSSFQKKLNSIKFNYNEIIKSDLIFQNG